MYTTENFKTKKALKEAVQDWNNHQKVQDLRQGQLRIGTVGHLMTSKLIAPPPVRIFQPGPFGGNEPRDGVVYLEGPHYPAAHTWYAEATLKDGVIVKVK